MQSRIIAPGFSGARVDLRFRGQEFLAVTRTMAARALKAGANVALIEYRRELGRSNNQGWNPSLPGEVPRKGTGRGVKSLYVRSAMGPNGTPMSFVTVGKEGKHLQMLERGTRPHWIRARRGKLLMIPWRGKGTIRNAPTRASISHYGLKKIGRNWYSFRREVYHPGTAPRPWGIPVMLRARNKINAAIANVLRQRPPGAAGAAVA